MWSSEGGDETIPHTPRVAGGRKLKGTDRWYLYEELDLLEDGTYEVEARRELMTIPGASGGTWEIIDLVRLRKLPAEEDRSLRRFLSRLRLLPKLSH